MQLQYLAPTKLFNWYPVTLKDDDWILENQPKCHLLVKCLLGPLG